MPTDVIMPQLGESIFEGTITKWLKKAGDAVEKDEPLFEISTDKVDAEIPSPVAGVLSEIKVPEGATVGVNTVVAVVSEIGEAVPAGPVPAPAAAGLAAARDEAQASEAAKAEAASGEISGGTDVVMPQLGESIFEGTITKWLKKAGEMVEKDEPLFEISTDKVDAEIPAPVAGMLSEIKVPAGATVGINTVVAVIGGTAAGPAQVKVAEAAPAQAAQGPGGGADSVPNPAAATPAVPAAAANGGERLRSSPLVRRMARDNNLDLGQIAGTGSEGRITKGDVLRHLSEHGPGGAGVPAATRTAGATTGPAGATASATADATLPGQVVPLTKMRAIIAERMAQSMQISPHVHEVFKVDMTRIVRVREREKGRFERENGVKLTYMPFIAAAAIEALHKFPIVNASLKDGFIHYHPHIDLGIAVALEWGLIVPVVKQAEERSFLGLARAIADLAERARGKKLKPDEASGSTFTLTNSGIFGDEFGTPIINQPESAILAIGGLKKEAVVLTDAEGNDTIAIRSMQHFCLGFDHRIIDGADGGRFMSEFKKTLEGWDREIG
ncbi:MAG: 2-oxoglutarate dehydrogenase, E2 component, dihydrolipoamide succinyltransferase [Terracidiphilus sp.]|jgi:2-oxoglutarate dehydrogenase E2 component (dihydrolipoamide succinyltransferase)